MGSAETKPGSRGEFGQMGQMVSDQLRIAFDEMMGDLDVQAALLAYVASYVLLYRCIRIYLM